MQVELIGGKLDGSVVSSSHGVGFTWIDQAPPFRCHRDPGDGRLLYYVSRVHSNKFPGVKQAILQAWMTRCPSCHAYRRKGGACPMCGVS